MQKGTHCKPWSHVGAVEDDAPPGVDGIVAQIHGGQHNGTENVLFITH